MFPVTLTYFTPFPLHPCLKILFFPQRSIEFHFKLVQRIVAGISKKKKKVVVWESSRRCLSRLEKSASAPSEGLKGPLWLSEERARTLERML